MSLIVLILLLLLIAGIAWLVNSKFPAVNPTIKFIINLVLVIVAIVLTLDAFGLWDRVKDIEVPKL